MKSDARGAGALIIRREADSLRIRRAAPIISVRAARQSRDAMHEPDDILTAAAQAEAVTKMRSFTDADGVRWRVSEQPFSDYDRRHGSSLIFESEAVVRRIRNYPADWYEHTDSQLAQLSWGI